MSGRVVLDTSVVIAHFRNEPAVGKRLLDASLLLLPVTALGELYTGALRKKQNRDKALETVQDFTSSVKLLRPDYDTARHYGELRSRVMAKGKPIPDNDLWIAAMAVQYGLPLANRDAHFDEIDGLKQHSIGVSPSQYTLQARGSCATVQAWRDICELSFPERSTTSPAVGIQRVLAGFLM